MIINFLKNIVVNAIIFFTPILIKYKGKIKKQDIGITTVLFHEGVDSGIISLLSFAYQTGRWLPISVFDDGSLTLKDKEKLSSTLKATIISYTNSTNITKTKFQKFKNFVEYRTSPYNPPTKLKFDAILQSPFLKTIYIEHDVMFYKKPEEIIEWIDNDIGFAYYLLHDRKLYGSVLKDDLDYSFRKLYGQYKNNIISSDFNTGILCVPHNNFVKMKHLDSVIKQFNKINYMRTFNSEETAYAITLNNSPLKPLPSGKYVCPSEVKEYEKAIRLKPVAVHYIASSKNRLRIDMAKYLIRSYYFRKNINY